MGGRTLRYTSIDMLRMLISTSENPEIREQAEGELRRRVKE